MLSKRHQEAVDNFIKLFEDAGYEMHIKLLNRNLNTFKTAKSYKPL